jgi:AcrR family transcriptional regulator
MTHSTVEKTSQVIDVVIPYTIGLFRKYGYRKTTVDEIAYGVHISKKTLYAVFPSKEMLLRETIWHDTIKTLHVFNSAVQPGTPTDILLLSLCRFIFTDRIKRGKDGYFWGLYADDSDIISASVDSIKRVVKALYEDGVQKGLFKPIDPFFATEAVVSIIKAAVDNFHRAHNPAQMFNDALNLIADAVAFKNRIHYDALV